MRDSAGAPVLLSLSSTHHLDTLNDVMEKASPLPADGNGGSSVIATLLGTVTAVIVAKLF